MSDLPNNLTGRKNSRVHPIDHHVGARIRQRRILLGLTQNQLAKRLDITCQQIHKYEMDVNRISAGRLYMIAQTLGVEVEFFFEDIVNHKIIEPTSQRILLLEFVRTVASIKNRRHQEALSNLVRAMANATVYEDNVLDTRSDRDLSAS